MEDRFSKGKYVEYPCTNGCGHHMRLKDDISELKRTDKAVLECPNCNVEQEHSVATLNSIVNSAYNLG